MEITEKARLAALSALPEPLGALLIERLGAAALTLPMLPDVAAEVLQLVQSDTTDAARLSSIVHRDQALASHLLRIANSPAYRPRSPIVSLQQAVARLGLTTLGEIALSVSVRGNLFRAAGYEAYLRDLWRHSALAGSFAKEIARARRQNVESAFLCGLLHDLGRPVLLAELVGLASKAQLPLTQGAALATLDALHAIVGGALAQLWQLPESVVMSLRHHHAPADAPAAADAVHMTSLADELARWAAGEREKDAVRAFPSVERLNLYPDAMDALFAHEARALAFAEALS